MAAVLEITPARFQGPSALPMIWRAASTSLWRDPFEWVVILTNDKLAWGLWHGGAAALPDGRRALLLNTGKEQPLRSQVKRFADRLGVELWEVL